MQITEKDIQKKGFAVLHGKWGGSGKVSSLVGINGKILPSISHFGFRISHSNQKSQIRNLAYPYLTAGRRQVGHKYHIGYLAYPNIGLKNIIPDRKFFGYKELVKLNKPPVINGLFKTSGHLQQSVTKSEYIKKIKQIKELLAVGEIYQMCYSIRFRKKFEGSPYALFLKLAEVNPVDFSAYLNCGNFQIVSSSPERLFKVSNGKITTTPIKGTACKLVNDQSSMANNQLIGDKNLKKLLDSEKERAELDMITDLERNDVGKICEYGTLKLKKEREILELKNLWHTYSEVEGKLRSDVAPKDVIEAMFPGGSITGCPKKRAMEYVSLYEGMPRNIFTGSIGLIKSRSISDFSFQNSDSKIINHKSKMFSMDFNIAIRTILIKDGWLEFWAGGGIVMDSVPEMEYEECYLKAEKILKLL